jgi:hypothetical protein
MLVALNGAKGSGKDTVASILIEGYDFKRLAFADKLKESAAAIWNIHPSTWDGLKNLEHSDVSIRIFGGKIRAKVSVREFLQRYGTEAHRDVFGKDFWVDHALKGINPNDNIVITDCRFENEIERVKSLGGVVVRIIRDELSLNDNHASEVEPPPHLIDYYLDNNETLEKLYSEVDKLIDWVYWYQYAEDDDYET